MYCVNENKDAKAHFGFFFNFSFCHSYITHMDVFCLSVPLFVHFSFSPMEISVSDLSAPIGASVFKFSVHLQVGEVYCVNEK